MSTTDLDLNQPGYEFLKYDLVSVYIQNANYVVYAEMSVVTYVDLLASVAGVPSFLLIIYKYLMKNFEKFYSNVEIYKSFKEENRPRDTQAGADSQAGSKDEAEDFTSKTKFGFW